MLRRRRPPDPSPRHLIGGPDPGDMTLFI